MIVFELDQPIAVSHSRLRPAEPFAYNRRHSYF